MAIRALSIDWPLDASAIHRQDFFGPLSLSSFDFVFLDPEDLPRRWTSEVAAGPDGRRRTQTDRDRGFGRTLSSWMQRRRTEASDLLKLGDGILVCRLRPRGEALEIHGDEGPGERIDRFSWLPSVSLVDRQHQLSFPSNGRFVPRRGEDVRLQGTGHPFEAYLETFEGHIRYDAVYRDVLSTPIDRFATILAKNRVGDAIALSIPYDEGRLILLPPVVGVSPAREGAVLLDAARALMARPAWAAEPDWLAGYPLPGEEELADELASLTERRDSLIAKWDEVFSRWSETTRAKRMLFTKGRFSYVDAVAEGFEALGFDVERTLEGLRVVSDEGDGWVVAEATEDEQVALPAYRRLLGAVDRSVTDGEGRLKGILVVSASLGLDPKRRPTQYTDSVLRGCEAHGFCLVTSYELFKMVQSARASRSKASRSALRRTLLETDGLFRAPKST